MKLRQIKLDSGAEIVLGKDEESNDELMRKFKGKDNIILHTAAPGSPFCVIKDKVSEEDIYASAVFCARYSQDWRDNKKDVAVNVFTPVLVVKFLQSLRRMRVQPNLKNQAV